MDISEEPLFCLPHMFFVVYISLLELSKNSCRQEPLSVLFTDLFKIPERRPFG